MMVIDQMCIGIYCFSFFPFYVLSFQEQLVAADHVLFDDTHHCLQIDDNNEHDTIVMEDEDETEMKEEDEEQQLIIIPSNNDLLSQAMELSEINADTVMDL